MFYFLKVFRSPNLVASNYNCIKVCFLNVRIVIDNSSFYIFIDKLFRILPNNRSFAIYFLFIEYRKRMTC